MALSLYHIDLRFEGEDHQFGVCAANKTEALKCLDDRLIADGGLDSWKFGRCERIGPQGTWSPGGTLWYY